MVDFNSDIRLILKIENFTFMELRVEGLTFWPSIFPGSFPYWGWSKNSNLIDVPEAWLSGNCIETERPAFIRHQKIMESFPRQTYWLSRTQTTFWLGNLTLEFKPGIRQIPGLWVWSSTRPRPSCRRTRRRKSPRASPPPPPATDTHHSATDQQSWPPSFLGSNLHFTHS